MSIKIFSLCKEESILLMSTWKSLKNEEICIWCQPEKEMGIEVEINHKKKNVCLKWPNIYY